MDKTSQLHSLRRRFAAATIAPSKAAVGADAQTASRSFDVIASSPVEDANGRIVIQDWDLARFEANPVVLWNHGEGGGFFGDSSDTDLTLPIGHASNVRLEGGKLMATITLVDERANPIAEKVFQGVSQKSIRAVSVGWRASDVRFEMHDNVDVVVLSGNELYEISFVAIPANPEAVMQESAKFAASLRNIAGEADMNFAKIAAILGLQASVGENEVLGAVRGVVEARDAALAAQASATTQLSRFETVLGAGADGVARAGALVETEKQYIELAATAKAKAEADRVLEISALLDQAEKDGKIAPAERPEREAFIANELGGSATAAKKFIASLHPYINTAGAANKRRAASATKSYREMSNAERHDLYVTDPELFAELRDADA